MPGEASQLRLEATAQRKEGHCPKAQFQNSGAEILPMGKAGQKNRQLKSYPHIYFYLKQNKEKSKPKGKQDWCNIQKSVM